MHTFDSQVPRRSAPQPSHASTWIVRLVAAALLVVAYFTAWQSVRTGWSHSVVYPALSALAMSSDTHRVVASAQRVVVVRTKASGGTTRFAVKPPAGVKFLLPALFIVLITPLRPYWLYFATGHIVLSAVTVGGGAILILVPGDADLFLAFVQSYLVDAYSLIVPVIVYVRNRLPHA